jgi:hypothetical protein
VRSDKIVTAHRASCIAAFVGSISALIFINAGGPVSEISGIASAGEARFSIYASRATSVCTAVVRVFSTLVIVDTRVDAAAIRVHSIARVAVARERRI